MRQDPNAFSDETRVLVFIAGSVGGAQRVETVLTSDGIDYCLLAEEFTQGILQRSSGAPELIVIGLNRRLAHFIVNEYNRRVRTGERFAAGPIASGFLEGFNCQFRPVHSSHHRAYLGRDVWLYHGEFQVRQLVYPTAAGVWPWDHEAEASSSSGSHSLRNLKAHANNRLEPARVARAAQPGR